MSAYHVLYSLKRRPSHPGGVLDDLLQDIKETKAEVAQALGVSRQHLDDILLEKRPVSEALAVQIGKLVGSGSELWLRLQAIHDAWQPEEF